MRWFDVIHEQLNSLAFLPESHSLSPENDDFPFGIRDKLVGLGSRPSYRAVFTIANDTVFVLSVRRADQDVVLRQTHDMNRSDTCVGVGVGTGDSNGKITRATDAAHGCLADVRLWNRGDA